MVILSHTKELGLQNKIILIWNSRSKRTHDHLPRWLEFSQQTILILSTIV